MPIQLTIIQSLEQERVDVADFFGHHLRHSEVIRGMRHAEVVGPMIRGLPCFATRRSFSFFCSIAETARLWHSDPWRAKAQGMGALCSAIPVRQVHPQKWKNPTVRLCQARFSRVTGLSSGHLDLNK